MRKEKTVTDTLDAREKTHGSYDDVSRISQSIKLVIRTGGRGWHNLSYRQRESLDMIASKMARIVNGDPNFQDHWLDICGYAMLAKDGN